MAKPKLSRFTWLGLNTRKQLYMLENTMDMRQSSLSDLAISSKLLSRVMQAMNFRIVSSTKGLEYKFDKQHDTPWEC